MQTPSLERFIQRRSAALTRDSGAFGIGRPAASSRGLAPGRCVIRSARAAPTTSVTMQQALLANAAAAA